MGTSFPHSDAVRTRCQPDPGQTRVSSPSPGPPTTSTNRKPHSGWTTHRGPLSRVTSAGEAEDRRPTSATPRGTIHRVHGRHGEGQAAVAAEPLNGGGWGGPPLSDHPEVLLDTGEVSGNAYAVWQITGAAKRTFIRSPRLQSRATGHRAFRLRQRFSASCTADSLNVRHLSMIQSSRNLKAPSLTTITWTPLLASWAPGANVSGGTIPPLSKPGAW